MGKATDGMVRCADCEHMRPLGALIVRCAVLRVGKDRCSPRYCEHYVKSININKTKRNGKEKNESGESG